MSRREGKEKGEREKRERIGLRKGIGSVLPI